MFDAHTHKDLDELARRRISRRIECHPHRLRCMLCLSVLPSSVLPKASLRHRARLASGPTLPSVRVAIKQTSRSDGGDIYHSRLGTWAPFAAAQARQLTRGLRINLRSPMCVCVCAATNELSSWQARAPVRPLPSAYATVAVERQGRQCARC